MKTFVALFMGTPGAATDIDDSTRDQGIAAWGAWMTRNASRIVDSGGPLGVTKKASREGVTDIRNRVAAYVVLQADSHQEAAELFLNHPHFTIFPGDSVEIMERLPVPGM